MTSLILQCVVSLLPICIAYYQTRQEFRKHSDKPKEEARWVLFYIVVVSIISIAFQINNYYDTKMAADKMDHSFNDLRIKNDKLEKQITEDSKYFVTIQVLQN